MDALILLQNAYRRNLQRERVFRDRSNDLETLDDNQLISRYRFPRAKNKGSSHIYDILRENISIKSQIKYHTLGYRVLVTLRFLAKGDFQSETEDIHGVTKPSVSRSISAVCNSICNNMDNILFPNDTEELRRIKEEFYDMAQVPNVVGAIDGTLIPIQGMSSDDEHVYVCKKGFHSLNIQAVVDAKMRQ
ncbi:hypothetical protein LOTGIDRAFT_145999 [Lottia gigantea]|uniref:Nuclease HARBI1 n=1 Tax=Lottia gigantea TaxID=225164 RepID=V3Z900_LOTGI|nr:hypothetical protein LOTGIDRAFT_145999 [Lottia gigantea]ESO87358.1 hypothetical protein LOTGIDRAFT_145999 [Lottia gigantea]